MRGASCGEVNPEPQATRLRAEESLEVEARESGSWFRPVSDHVLNGKGEVAFR